MFTKPSLKTIFGENMFLGSGGCYWSFQYYAFLPNFLLEVVEDFSILIMSSFSVWIGCAIHFNCCFSWKSLNDVVCDSVMPVYSALGSVVFTKIHSLHPGYDDKLRPNARPLIGRFWGAWNHLLIVVVTRSTLTRGGGTCWGPGCGQVVNSQIGVKTLLKVKCKGGF